MTGVRVELSRDGGSTWEVLAPELDPGTTSHLWEVTGPLSTDCGVRVSDSADAGVSGTKRFEIAVGSLSLTAPAGGEVWGIGFARAIEWSQLGLTLVDVELSRDGGSTWEVVAESVSALDGSYGWLVTGPESAQCVLRVSDAMGGPFADEGAQLFEVVEPSVTLVSPNGLEHWTMGSEQSIEWTAVGIEELRIDISRDEGASWTNIAASVPAETGSYPWRLSTGGCGAYQPDCLIRLVCPADENLSDTSDGTFVIVWDRVYRVRPSATLGGDGKTWETALKHPQDAMAVSSPTCETWVAAGTYYPRDVGGGSVLVFEDGAKFYGGFHGDEYARDQRDWVRLPTILHGNSTALHVVVGASASNESTTVLDGFSITGGVAGRIVGESEVGGGIYNYWVRGMEVANCRIFGNSAAGGGWPNPPTGAGAYNDNSDVTFRNCTFSDNRSMEAAGAYCSRGEVYFIDCTFERNKWEGAYSASGVYIDGHHYFYRCRFVDNEGSGLRFGTGAAEVVNCVFQGNTASPMNGGGAISASSSSRVITVTNCTIYGNSADYAQAIYQKYTNSVSVKNTIIWGNGASSLNTDSPSDMDITYSCLDFDWPDVGNVFADPCFGIGLHLYAHSPCVDAGTSEGAPSEDIEGRLRPAGGGYDMGAYEDH